MATDHTNAAHTTADRTTNRLPSLPVESGWRDHVPTSQAATAATAVAYAVVSGGLLVGAGLVTVAVASLLGGGAGLVMFGAVGLPVMAAAPLAARLLVPGVSAGRTLDSRDDHPPQTAPVTGRALGPALSGTCRPTRTPTACCIHPLYSAHCSSQVERTQTTPAF